MKQTLLKFDVVDKQGMLFPKDVKITMPLGKCTFISRDFDITSIKHLVGDACNIRIEENELVADIEIAQQYQEELFHNKVYRPAVSVTKKELVNGVVKITECEILSIGCIDKANDIYEEGQI